MKKTKKELEKENLELHKKCIELIATLAEVSPSKLEEGGSGLLFEEYVEGKPKEDEDKLILNAYRMPFIEERDYEMLMDIAKKNLQIFCGVKEKDEE